MKVLVLKALILLGSISMHSEASILDYVDSVGVRGSLSDQSVDDVNEDLSIEVELTRHSFSSYDQTVYSHLYLSYSVVGPKQVRIVLEPVVTHKFDNPLERDADPEVFSAIRAHYREDEALGLDSLFTTAFMRYSKLWDWSESELRVLIKASIDLIGIARMEHIQDQDHGSLFSGLALSTEIDLSKNWRISVGVEHLQIYKDGNSSFTDAFLEIGYALTDTLEFLLTGGYTHFEVASDEFEAISESNSRGTVTIRYYPKTRRRAGYNEIRFRRENNLLF